MSRNTPSWRTRITIGSLVLLLIATTVAATLATTRPSSERTASSNPQPTRISVIGDSYSSGLGNAVVWPSLFADSTTLGIANFAIPGSGYVGGAGESGPFSTQVDKALAVKPDVIVVFGGINDVGKSSELIQQAATDLFTELARRAPMAQIMVIGPLWHEDPPPEEAIAIDEAVNAAAESTNTSYIRVIDETWLVDPGLIQQDDIHPTDAGQTVMARELGAILTQRVRTRSDDAGA